METFETSNIPLYKIGTDWVFNVSDRTGYFVVRSKNRVVLKFRKAFYIKSDGSTRYYLGVPVGVVRKANKLLELQSEGNL